MTTSWFADCRTLDEIRKRYHKLAMQYHPDRGGSNAVMAEINAAYDQACRSAGRSQQQTYQTYSRRETRHEYARRPEPENLNYVLRVLILRLVGMAGLKVELCGTWIWVSGDTRRWHEQLKEMGLKWASKKQMWYFAGTPPKGHRMTMQQIRTHFGSRVFSTEDVE